MLLLPILLIFLIISITLLIIGVCFKHTAALLLLNLLWWAGSLVSGYFAWLAWEGQPHSGNWATIGFMFFSLPYIITTGALVITEMAYIRHWQGNDTLKLISGGLLVFLLMQVWMGFGAGVTVSVKL